MTWKRISPKELADNPFRLMRSPCSTIVPDSRLDTTPPFT
jgi:hypothetical protein